MTHASSIRIASMGKSVMRRIDAHMRRQMGIFEIWDDPRSQFRVSLETTSRPMNVPGLSLPAGTRILDLHFWSEHALDQPTEGAATGVSLKQYKLIIASFKAIGKSLKTDPRLEGVQAVHALTPLFFREESNAGQAMMARLGFTVVPYRNPMGAFGQFWQDLHIWLLTWAIKPEVLGRRTRFKNVWSELWFSADAYVHKFGPKEKGRKPCSGRLGLTVKPWGRLSMVFDLKGLLRFTRRWVSDTGWTPRRRVIFAAFLFGYPLLEGIIWAGLLMDDLLFQRYRREPVPSPVFIIGNHRSGTTFLHRLLSKDRQQFATMKMWEILLAPSITQRRVVGGIAEAARWFREKLIEGLKRLERDWHEKSVMHDVSFQEPEEDDYLLLHIWSALTTGLSSGLLAEAIPYTYFDTALPKKDRHRIMGFYRQCIQRHMFADRANHRLSRTYLAKNPAFSPKVATARRFFPDARFIYLVRNPLEMIPSFVSMMRFSWDVLGIPGRDRALADYITEMARHWYAYPLEQLDAAPKGQAVIVTYDELTRDPKLTVQRIYSELNLNMEPDFAAVLNTEAETSKSYKSRHHYDLNSLGLSRDTILDAFKDVFDRFGFDTSVDS